MQQIQSTIKFSDSASESDQPLSWNQHSFTPPNLSTICHQYIEQIVVQVSGIGGWVILLDNAEKPGEKIHYFSCQDSTFDPETLSYIQSETWLNQEWPVCQLIPLQLTIPSSQKKFEEPVQARIYLYLYFFLNVPKNVPLPTRIKPRDYFLLWCKHSLSESQKIQIEQQVKLMDTYLKIATEHRQQQDKIHLLEQVIRKGEHQLRNPLALISLYAENLCLGLPMGSFQEQAEVIRNTVNELTNNLTHLLCCGQQHKLNLSFNNLSTIVAESLQILQPKIKEKQLQLQVSQLPISLRVDPWQLKQVFDNLFGNAIELSPVGGTITCDWQVYKHEVFVEICDQGPGISPEDLPNIFNPFFTKRSGGTGLGLTIVKKIILDHQGTIWAENIVGGGAVFSFVLPR